MFQIFVKDRCTSQYGIHRIEEDENTTMNEFKKLVYKKTHVPSSHQKFLYQTKYLNHESNIMNQIDYESGINWACIDLMFRQHAPNCSCIKCGGIIFLW